MGESKAYRVKAGSRCRLRGIRMLGRHFTCDEWTVVQSCDLSDSQLAVMLHHCELVVEPLSDSAIAMVEDERSAIASAPKDSGDPDQGSLDRSLPPGVSDSVATNEPRRQRKSKSKRR